MAKRVPTLDPVEEFEDELDEELEATVEKLSEEFEASLTSAVPVAPEPVKENRVTVFLPKLIGDDNGVTVDQYEHVTIANERGEICYKVLRGEPVEVPISVFMVLKQKYPKI